MLEIGCFSSSYAHFPLLIVAFKKKKKKKKLWAEDYAAETFYISNFKSNNDYVVRLFKQIFHIILVFLDALRTPKRSQSECATTSSNALKIACNLVML